MLGTLPFLFTSLGPTAGFAMRAWFGLREDGRIRYKSFELLAKYMKEMHIIHSSQGFLSCISEDNVHPFRDSPLLTRQKFTIDAELYDVFGSCVPRKFSVNNLIAIGAKCRRSLDASQKVRIPVPR